MYDVIIIGAGTAGMTAGIYLARRGASAIILEGNNFGGQIVNALEIKNFPAIKSISGFDFANQLHEQVTALGVKTQYEKVINLKKYEDRITVTTTENNYDCKNVIVAVGAKNKKLGIKDEEKFIGLGVSYCATCDGNFFKNKTVAVIGGRSSALEDAEYLAKLCKKVYLIHSTENFKGNADTMANLKKCSNVEFITNTVLTKLGSETDVLSYIEIQNTLDNSRQTLDVSGLFVAVGQAPGTDFLDGVVDLDDKGYVIAQEDCKTSADNIYAVGDCRTKTLRQLTTAAADGSIAASKIKLR